MALVAVDASSDNVNCGSAAVLDNLGIATVAVWFNPSSVANATRIIARKENTLGWSMFRRGASGAQVQLTRHRNADTNNQLVRTPTGALVVGMPSFLVGVFDVVNGNPQMFHGSLWTKPTDVSTGATAGSGTKDDDSAGSLEIMKTSSEAAGGTYYWFGLWPRRLNANEIATLWQSFLPGARDRGPHVTPGSIIWMPLGQNGASQTQRDLSGWSNHGTVTTATFASDHPFTWA